ncbi:MAG: secretin N-terminal domain-containing protein [Prosthecobacter sp.]
MLDFLPVAYNALARDTDIQANEGAASIDGGGSRRRSSSGSGSLGADNGGFNSTGGSRSNFGDASGFSTGSNANRSVLDEPEDLGAPKSMIVGKTQLIADPQSNSLVVSGSPEHIARIDQLLTEMDVRPQQIYISAIIGQLNLGNEYNFGSTS